jgi:hypothetical protein
LDFVIDTLFGTFCLSKLQKDKLASAITSCLSKPQAVPAKLVAKVTGLTNSISLVTGPVSGLFSRFLHRALAQRSNWYSKLDLDSAARFELQFWQQNLHLFASKPIWRGHSLLRVLFYDAGGQGWRGHLEIGASKYEAHRSWAAHEKHSVTGYYITLVHMATVP